jgi:hypothetical protein
MTIMADESGPISGIREIVKAKRVKSKANGALIMVRNINRLVA